MIDPRILCRIGEILGEAAVKRRDIIPLSFDRLRELYDYANAGDERIRILLTKLEKNKEERLRLIKLLERAQAYLTPEPKLLDAIKGAINDRSK